MRRLGFPFHHFPCIVKYINNWLSSTIQRVFVLAGCQGEEASVHGLRGCSVMDVHLALTSLACTGLWVPSLVLNSKTEAAMQCTQLV